jgi:hypothetical protein
MAPHRHLVVDVTDTSARTNTNVPRIGARPPLPDSLALGAQHGKLDADLRTSALLGTSSAQPIHDYYPFFTHPHPPPPHATYGPLEGTYSQHSATHFTSKHNSIQTPLTYHFTLTPTTHYTPKT